MFVFRKIRLLLKQFIVAIGFGSYLIEFCERCGRRQPLSWWSPDEIWLSVQGQSCGAYCPECFDKMASAKGWFLRWKPIQHEGIERQEPFLS